MALAARDIIPTWVASAESERAFHDAAQASFLILAERAGERGDNLGRLWSIVWGQGKAVVIGTELDANVVPGEATGMRRVADRLDALADLGVPTVAFVADGCAPAEVEIAAEIPAPPQASDAALESFPAHAQRAFAVVGRLLHLRNAGTWTWSDIPADAGGGDVVVGMAWLAAHGHVLPTGTGGLRFASTDLLAQARGHAPEWIRPPVAGGAGAPRSPVTVLPPDGQRAAAPEVAGEPYRSEPAMCAEFTDVLRSDLPVLTSGVRRRGRPHRRRRATGGGRGEPAQRMAAGGWAATRGRRSARCPPPPAHPCLRHAPALGVGGAARRRPAALVPHVPIRRELVSQLAVNPQRTVPAVLPQWRDDIAALPDPSATPSGAALRAPGPDSDPAEVERWASLIGMACHIAWALPAIYATAAEPWRTQLDPLLDRLNRISTATAHLALTDATASIDFLQAWGEGLYYGSLQGGSPYTGVATNEPAPSQPWPYRLALVMTVAAARGPAEQPRPDDHPIVLAMIDELERVSLQERAPGAPDSVGSVLWGEEFEALRTGAPGITPRARWILAAKAVLFSAAEARRGPKPHGRRASRTAAASCWASTSCRRG